jgi:hypothetical protein
LNDLNVVADGGYRMIVIPRTQGGVYIVSYRQGNGFDTNMGTVTPPGSDNPISSQNAIHIHYQASL